MPQIHTLVLTLSAGLVIHVLRKHFIFGGVYYAYSHREFFQGLSVSVEREVQCTLSL